jgi:hypothetical protein
MTLRRRARRWRAAAAALALTTARPLAAQSSPYLPLDDVAYGYIDALQARGELRELSILERPYTVAALRAALERAAAAPGRDALLDRWRAPLLAATGKYFRLAMSADSSLVAAGIGPYVTAQTSGRRELMLADSANDVGPGFSIRLLLHAGPATVVARGFGDRRLRDDAEFFGRRDRVLAGRMEDAYVLAQWPLVELSAGRVARRWSPPGVQGLQLGNYAYSYDHLFLRLGGSRARLSTVLARLDNVRLGPDTVAQRFFTAHRLAGRIGSVELGLGEALVYGGPSRGFEPTLSNPAGFFTLTQNAENQQINVNFGADVAWRPRWGGSLSGQLLLDDFQIDRCGAGCAEPTSYGVTGAADGIPLGAPVRAFASYTRVSNLAYRTHNAWELYASYNVGLGAGYSDFDEARAGLDVGPLLAFPVRAYAALRRQGEGDYRAPYPEPESFLTVPGFLAGVTARTLRLGVEGSARLGAGIELRGDVGVNRLTNAGHEVGASRTAFEGRVTVALEPTWLRAAYAVQ